MASASHARLVRAIPATRQLRRPHARKQWKPSSNGAQSGRGYRIVDAHGCGFVAESAEGSATGDDIVRRARHLDEELVRLARGDGLDRLVFGRLAGRFIEMRGHERLGFAQLGDYGAERLGWSGRQLQETARVVGALARLPLIENAFRRATLSWSKARLLASIVSESDQAAWLIVALATDVRSLATATSSARAAAREQRPAVTDIVSNYSDVAIYEPLVIEEDDLEEHVLLRIPCSQRAKRMWNQVRRLAPRMAGRALSQSKIAELVAGEASSAPGPFHDLWQQEPWCNLASSEARTAQRDRSSSPAASCVSSSCVSSSDHSSATVSRNAEKSEDSPDRASGDAALLDEPTASSLEGELTQLQELDAFALDAAMRKVRRSMQERQSRLGNALGLFLELRLYDTIGYACGATYIRERLGISDRTARELVRVARMAQSRSPELASAYARGELSWLCTLTLLPIVRSWNASAWLERAGEVTLRRLADEVAWSIERAEVEPEHFPAMPPALGANLCFGDDQRQMCVRGAASDHASGDGDHVERGNDDQQRCAHDRLDDCGIDSRKIGARDDDLWNAAGRVHVAFLVPLSVSVLFRTAMQGFASPLEPRWKAFERMLEHVLAQWRSQPRHHDPVFSRDGYRCSTPGCSSFSSLHDHHIIPRSVGGTNELSNRTTLCAWHHLRAVHGGLARARGQAPLDIEWKLGLSADRPPLMHLRGDQYLRQSRPGTPSTPNNVSDLRTSRPGSTDSVFES